MIYMKLRERIFALVCCVVAVLPVTALGAAPIGLSPCCGDNPPSSEWLLFFFEYAGFMAAAFGALLAIAALFLRNKFRLAPTVSRIGLFMIPLGLIHSGAMIATLGWLEIR